MHTHNTPTRPYKYQEQRAEDEPTSVQKEEVIYYTHANIHPPAYPHPHPHTHMRKTDSGVFSVFSEETEEGEEEEDDDHLVFVVDGTATASMATPPTKQKKHKKSQHKDTHTHTHLQSGGSDWGWIVSFQAHHSLILHLLQ